MNDQKLKFKSGYQLRSYNDLDAQVFVIFLLHIHM